MNRHSIKLFWTAFLDPDIYAVISQYCDALSLADQLRSHRQVIEIFVEAPEDGGTCPRVQFIKDYLDSRNIPFDDEHPLPSWNAQIFYTGKNITPMQRYFGETTH